MWDKWRGQLWLDCCCRVHIISTGCTTVWLKKHNLLKVKLETARKPGFIVSKAQVTAVVILLFMHCFLISFLSSRLCSLFACKYARSHPLYMQDKVNWFLLARWLELHDTFLIFFFLKRLKFLHVIRQNRCDTAPSGTQLAVNFPHLQSPLIGQLKQAWPSATNNSRAAVLNQFSRAKLAGGFNFANVWHEYAVWCQLKAAAVLTRCFRSSVLFRREKLLLVRTLTFKS